MKKRQPKVSSAPEMDKAQPLVEESYRLLFEKHPHPMWVYDQKTWQYLAVNEAAIDHYGYSREEFLQMSIIDIRPPEEAPALREFVTRELAGPVPTVHSSGIWKHWKKDGTIIDVEITSSRICFKGHASVLVLGTDVTERLRSERALRQSEARFQALATVSPAGIFRLSLNLECLYANQQVSNITGLPISELLGKGWMRSVHPEDQWVYGEFLKAIAERRPYQAELRFQTPEGQTRWILGKATAELGPAGEPIAYVGMIVDISERKKAEDLLRDSELRFRTAFDNAPNGMVLLGLDGRILQVNHFICEMLGYSEAESLKLCINEVTHPDDVAKSWEVVRRVMRGEGNLFEVEKRYIHKSGRIVWALLRGTVIRSGEGHPLYYLGHVQDITHRKQAEADREQLFHELETSRNNLQQLSRRLVQVQEAERRRIALELHDQVGQELTALKLGLERCHEHQACPSGSAFEEAHSRVQRLLTMVRDLSLDLRPTMLDDLGLLDALLWYLDRFKVSSGLRVDFKHRGVGHRRFPAETETAAFRIVQEALTNVTRHSQAKEVRIWLWASKERLTISIEDQGIGFDAEAVLRANTSTGLSGMQERAALLGGCLTIDSAAGRGTSLTAELPLQDKAGEQLPP